MKLEEVIIHKMIILKEYETEDWVKIDDAIEPFSPLMPTKSFLEMTKKNSLAITGIEDGNVMACGGISYIGEGEGIIWVKMSKKCLKQAFRWARSIKETFEIMKESLGSMTITTYILEEFCKGEKMARMIGMKKIGIPCKFNDKMYNKYAVVI